MANQVGDQWQGKDGNWYSSEADANLAHGGDGGSGAGWGSMSGAGGDVFWLAVIAAKLFLILIKSGILPGLAISLVLSTFSDFVFGIGTGTSIYSNITAFLVVLAVGFIIAFVAWRKRSKPLFIVIGILCAIGLVSSAAALNREEKVASEGEAVITATAIMTVDTDDVFLGIRASSPRADLILKKGTVVSVIGKSKRYSHLTQIVYEGETYWVLTKEIQIQNE